MRADESSLIELAAAGSTEAAAELYERYWPLAWQWAYLLTGSRVRADDLAQEAVLRAFGALDRFDAQRPFGPWLKRIVVNKAIDDGRRERRMRVGDEWLSELKPAPEHAGDASDDVVAAVRTLSPARREVIVLHYWLDLAVDEIAALLGLPFGTVASRLSRALGDLRVALEADRV